MTAPLRAVICEDEPLARERLRALVESHPDLALAGDAADGAAAVALIDRVAPDLVFLDVEMPERSGLEVLAAIRSRPAVIFTTAYDAHAVRAFELGAVDYLLKPFGAERFRRAVARALETRDDRRADAAERLEAVRGEEAGPLERLFVRDRGRIVPIAVREIVRLEARDDYVAVFAGGQRHLVGLTLGELERRLDPRRFVRVHRSHVVNLDAVTAMEPYDAHRMTVCLNDGSRVVSSRTHAAALKGLAL